MGDCWWSAAASIVLGRLPFAEQGMSRRTVPYTAPTEKGSNVRDAMHGLERVATRGTTGALVRGARFVQTVTHRFQTTLFRAKYFSISTIDGALDIHALDLVVSPATHHGSGDGQFGVHFPYANIIVCGAEPPPRAPR